MFDIPLVTHETFLIKYIATRHISQTKTRRETQVTVNFIPCADLFAVYANWFAIENLKSV